jgi:predicted nucleic acid-binding protein
MGKRYLIDTNTAIHYLDNKLNENAVELIESSEAQISVISRMELLVWPNASLQQLTILTLFVNASFVFNLDEPIILKAIEVRKKYRLKLPDAIIAATALVHDLTLITHDTKDFNSIQGLKTIDPHKL